MRNKPFLPLFLFSLRKKWGIIFSAVYRMDDIQELLRKMTLEMLDKRDIETLRDIGGDDEVEKYIKNHMFKIENEFKVNAIKQVLQRKYYNYYAKIIEEDDKCEHEIYETLKTLKKIKTTEEIIKNSNYVFITICPKQDDYLQLAKIIDKFIKLKFVKKYLYVFEQRYDGENNDKQLGDGLHAHLLIDKGDYKPSHVRRDLTRICGELIVNIDIKMIKPSDLPKTENYLIGCKNDENKRKKQEQDKIWRQIMKMRDYYGESFLSDA